MALPTSHTTKEEIDQQLEGIEEHEENLQDDPPEDQDIESEDLETDEPEDDDGESDDSEDEGDEDEPTGDRPQTERKDKQDYKKLYEESTREALVLSAKNKKVQSAIAEAGVVEPPQDDEMAKLYPEWEVMSQTEKQLAKNAEQSKRQFQIMTSAIAEATKIDAWTEKITNFTNNPQSLQQYPQLEGKEIEFRKFATRKTRRGMDMHDLMAAFSFNLGAEGKPMKNRGELFNRGSAGERAKPKLGETTPEDASVLRTQDPKRYRELIRGGKLKIKV